MTGSYFWYVTTAVYFLIFLFVLVVVIRLQSQFGATHGTFEAPAVEKREIFQRADAIDLVYCIVAPEAGAFVKIWSVHGFVGVLQHF